ncbi:MAG TPA: SRPBCC domain-containing protein [Terracidiphilus sp.]|jgi:uncharacterized protein YndB with AHSA1/START domain
MATTSIANNGDAIVSEIYIAAPPEEVFRALVDPALVVKWWGGQGEGRSFRYTHFQCDLRPGGTWRSAGIDAQGRPFEATGEYVEIDPPHLLVQTWTASWTAQVTTTVRWELRPTDSGTLVRHQHSGLAAHPDVAKSFRGWPRILGWMQAFLEKGETVDDRWAAIPRDS